MAARIHELRAAREKLKNEANAALRAAQAKAKAESRAFGAEELAADDKARLEIAAVDAEIDVEERILASERAFGSDLPHRGDDPPVPGAGPVGEKPLIAKADGFQSIGEMMHAAARATRGPAFVDPRLLAPQATPKAGPQAAASGASESIDSDGGYLVSMQAGGTLLSQTYETGLLTRRVTHQPIGDGFNSISLRLLDETSRANGSRFGGIQALWLAEADAFTGTKPKFRKLEMKLQKLMGLMYMTDELMADATALTGYVNEWFPQEFGFKLDDAIMSGTGAGIPLGILNAPAKVAIAKEVGQVTKTVLAENLEKMYAAMPASSLGNAEFFINVEVWPQLFKLSHAVGVGGVPVFIPGGGISQAPFGTLFGRPITPIEQALALGTEGDVVFADLSRYMLIDKGPIQTAASMHVRFLNDEMAFRWVLRCDGQPIPNAPITPYKGAQSLSPFITIATR
jgi:HK97 family phage major capsid protein